MGNTPNSLFASTTSGDISLGLKDALRMELAGLSSPFDEERIGIIQGVDPDFLLSVAEEFAKVLMYIGALGSGVYTIHSVVRRVKSVFARKKPTVTIDSVLLFLIEKYQKDGSGAIIKQICHATKRSQASVRNALKSLEAAGVARRSRRKFANCDIWFYARLQ